MLSSAWLSQPVVADLLRVPEDYPTIAQAANVAQPGDSIQVGPGQYNNEVFNLASGVTLFGLEDPQTGVYPFLDYARVYLLSGPDSTVVKQLNFHAGPSQYSIVSNFTRASVSRCHFSSSGPFFWASIYFPYGGAVRFSDFLGGLESMGIRHEQGKVEVAYCAFIVQNPITVFNEGHPQPADVVLRNNNFSGYSDFFLNLGSTMEIVNNIFYNATLATCHGEIPPSAVRYNDFFGNGGSCFGYGEGNIFLDPMYCDFPYGSWLPRIALCRLRGRGCKHGCFPGVWTHLGAGDVGPNAEAIAPGPSGSVREHNNHCVRTTAHRTCECRHIQRCRSSSCRTAQQGRAGRATSGPLAPA